MDFSERRKEVKVIRKFQSYILVGFPPPPWFYSAEFIDFWTVHAGGKAETANIWKDRCE